MKIKPFIYHLVFWTSLYVLWIAIFRSYAVALSKTVTIEFCYLVFIMLDFYAINNFIIPRFFVQKSYGLFIASTGMLIALSAWLRALVAVEMNSTFFHAPVSDFPTLYVNSLLNIALWVLIITTGKMLLEKIQSQQQYELLEKARVHQELDYLKAQINPHALFNSLNTIYGHIDKNNQTARNILLQFSELLRYQLYDCSAEKIGLEKEIEYLRNYVEFQRLRKDEALHVEFDTGQIEQGLHIAPLLLVILFENAFKYVGNLPGRENRICVHLSTENKQLKCRISNTVDGNVKSGNTNGNGIGLTNLKRRLELLYGGKYRLTTEAGNTIYETQLMINLV